MLGSKPSMHGDCKWKDNTRKELLGRKEGYMRMIQKPNCFQANLIMSGHREHELRWPALAGQKDGGPIFTWPRRRTDCPHWGLEISRVLAGCRRLRKAAPILHHGRRTYRQGQPETRMRFAVVLAVVTIGSTQQSGLPTHI